MEGGRLIGQGTYGCVFQPSLECKRKHINKSKVGKISRTKYIEKELFAYNVLHKVKEAKDYFILPIPSDNCVLKDLNEQPEKDLNKCEFLKRDGSVQQIVMPYGGVDLNLSPKVSFFSLFQRILEAGAIMLLQGFVHYDIHQKNIIIDKFGISRIIDFGQSFSIQNISLETIDDRWKILAPEYSAEPPEVTFLTSIDDYNKYTPEESFLKVLPKKRILSTIEKVLGIPVQQQIQHFIRFYKTSKSFQQKDLIKIWSLYYTGFDSWAIGVVLVEQLQKLLFIYEFVESSEWKLKRVIITEILQRMLTINPKERIDCMEALAMLDPFNSVYEDYGIEWVKARRKQRSH